MINKDTLGDSFKRITLENAEIWKNSAYAKFLEEADMTEVLKSQMEFFYAVSKFSSCLIKLATLIESNEKRILLIENIWEEHGNGDASVMHENTFLTHLKALGYKGEEIPKSPFITNFIDSLLSCNDKDTLGSRLSAIEYIYAVISNRIAEKLEELPLLCEQEHYGKHGEIDWEHGRELLMVIDKPNKDVFDKEQKDFIRMFETMIVPTKSELEEIKNNKVSFYWAREDVNAENQAMELIDGEDLLIETITSGGEQPLNFALNNRVKNVIGLDMNVNQNKVAEQKIEMNPSMEYGKFELLFEMLGRYIKIPKSYSTEKSDIKEDEIQYALDRVFNEYCLTYVFGDDAVKHSKGNFPEHFKNAFVETTIGNSLNYNMANIIDIINASEVKTCPIESIFSMYQDDHIKKSIKKINLKTVNLKTYVFNNGTNIIDLSNIGDWMPLDDFKEIVSKAYEKIEKGGLIIVRRLLGNYSLENDVMPKGAEFHPLKDNTLFYSETAAFKK